MAPVVQAIRLSTGQDLPTVGLGVYQAAKGNETYNAVLSALNLGYRHVDTAQVYGNEDDVGRALLDSGLRRGDVFITTKLWKSKWGYDRAAAGILISLKKLQTPYIDLILLHCPGDAEPRAETWRALEDAQRKGLVRNIGVSNFGAPHLEKLAQTATVMPCVNQIEVSPFLQRTELVRYCQAKGIVVQAYSPLCKAAKLGDPVVTSISTRMGLTPAQILIRWSLQKGLVCLPKSVSADRQRTNLDVYGFELSAQDMAKLDGLEEGLITGWDPITQDPV